MPVTAKLSRKFYDALGDEVANELVEWFNQVDLAYRTDLRELNELNFARFEAKLDERLAQLEARWEGRFAQLEGRWEGRLARIEARVDGIATRIDAKLDRLRAELIKWMFGFWAGSIGLALAIVQLT